MLRKRAPNFAEQVWVAAGIVGVNAPRIVDHILAELFPATHRAAEDEGALTILRNGCIAEAKRVLRTEPSDGSQFDFSEISPVFQPLVKRLHRRSYFVASQEEEVPIARLIEAPNLLDEARQFLRRKGEECIAEAERLDELYAAVTSEAA